MIWKIFLFSIILVLSILYFDKFISYEPKSRFGKWWRNHIINRLDD